MSEDKVIKGTVHSAKLLTNGDYQVITVYSEVDKNLAMSNLDIGDVTGTVKLDPSQVPG